MLCEKHLVLVTIGCTEKGAICCNPEKFPGLGRNYTFCRGESVISFSPQIDGDEWQELVVQLLFMRYGANLVEVPDQHKGDSGIEAFSTDGCAFQCYSPEGQAAFAETAQKHKKKITKDLKKFRVNHIELARIGYSGEGEPRFRREAERRSGAKVNSSRSEATLTW